VLALSSGTDRIRALAEPVAAELGLEVLDIELHGSAPRQVLRIYLDSPSQGSVTVADCEAVSRRLGDVLDAHDALSGRYMLEVSSPGVNRPLIKPEHFRRVVGGRVRIRRREAKDGVRNIVGRLMSFDGQTLGIETDDGRRCDVAFEEMEKANFEHEFPSVTRPGRRRR
jgi:ribosome maturation factor RimP